MSFHKESFYYCYPRIWFCLILQKNTIIRKQIKCKVVKKLNRINGKAEWREEVNQFPNLLEHVSYQLQTFSWHLAFILLIYHLQNSQNLNVIKCHTCSHSLLLRYQLTGLPDFRAGEIIVFFFWKWNNCVFNISSFSWVW